MPETNPDVIVLREGTEGLSTDEYAAELQDRLPKLDVRHAGTPAQERDLVADACVVTGVSIDEDLLSRASNLQLFACAFAGTGHLPTDKLRDAGVAVTNAGGIHAPGIAEQALGQMLTFARRLHEGWRRNQRHEWRHFKSYELAGSTVTVIGLGSIGQALVQRLQGFEVHIIGVRYTPEKGGPSDEVLGFGAADVHDALSRSDYVVLACPLTEETRNLLSPDEFATLPPHAVVVNTSRGAIIDTDALVAEVQRGGLRGAALDVTDPEPLPADHPLWRLENVLITPHTGGHTPRHWDRLADIVAENIEALTDGADPSSLRNLVIDP